MNDLAKQKQKERIEQELLLIQKYFFSEEWIAIREDIVYQLEITEDYLKADNHLVPELTESYNSLISAMNWIMERYYEQISSTLVKSAIKIAIDHNNQKFFHFPWLGESRDTKRYSKKDVYRWERNTYQNLLRMEESYIKNIWQEEWENDNSNEGWLDSWDLWSWVYLN